MTQTEAIESLGYAAKAIANAITPVAAAAGHDALGGHVESLTEAVMGMTAALTEIATAIGDVAEAIKDRA